MASCSICLDVFLPQSQMFALHCGHVYHMDCANEWSKRSRECPQCKGHIGKLRKIYLSFTQDSDNMEANINKLKELIPKVESFETANQKLMNDIGEKDKNIEDLKKTAAINDENIKKLEQELKNKTEERNDLQRKLLISTAHHEHIEKQLQASLDEWNETFMKSTLELSKKDDELNGLLKVYEEIEVNATTTATRKMDADIKEKNEKISALQDELRKGKDELEKKLEAANEKISILHREIHSLTKNSDEVVNGLKKEIRSLRRGIKLNINEALNSPQALKRTRSGRLYEDTTPSKKICVATDTIILN